MKKLTVIGRGTAGCIAIGHFLKYTDWYIDWIFDNKTSPQAVGEGSDLIFMRVMKYFDFQLNDMETILDGSVKAGIKKVNWGKENREFIHHFEPGMHSYHFNATKLQEFVLQWAKNYSRVRIIDENISNLENLDSDYVMNCSGKPTNYDDYNISEYIPVNAVHVTQCFWDGPRFPYTLAIARPYGWVFGIPLINRCSIGYMYNHNINTLEEVKEDVKNIFSEYNLTPSEVTNSFKFNNYYHKQPFGSKICYNGNACFFLEPLEATSINLIQNNMRRCYDLWNGISSVETITNGYETQVRDIEHMIMMHYYAGSPFDTEFWKVAQSKGEKNMEKFFVYDRAKKLLESVNKLKTKASVPKFGEDFPFGSWSSKSYKENFVGLGIEQKIYSSMKI